MQKDVSKIIFAAGLVAGAVLIGICGIKVSVVLNGSREAREEYQTLEAGYVHMAEADNNGGETKDAENTIIEVDSDSLVKINSDYIGWLYFKDAGISLPLVQEKGGTNSLYLSTTFGGKKNSSGCPFISNDAASDFSDNNTFVFGHNALNGGMFGGLKALYDNLESCMDPYFYISEKSGETKKYRVISAVKTSADGDMYHASLYRVPSAGEDYAAYIEEALAQGRFDASVVFSKEEEATIKAQSPLVTLSTYYGHSDFGERILIIGVKI